MRQKGESQNRCYKKTKHAKFSDKRTFLPPDKQTHACVFGSKKCSFIRESGVLCFLVTSDLRFALLPYYRRYDSFEIPMKVKNVYMKLQVSSSVTRITNTNRF